MRELDDLKPEEIRQAIRKLAPGHGVVETHTLLHDIARELDSSTTTALRDFRARSAYDRYCARVARALDKLAADGELIKVGKNQRKPDGTRAYRGVYYYTPEWFTEDMTKAEGKAAAEALNAGRWDQVTHELAGLGYFWAGDGRDHQLSLADWEQLIAQWKQETGRAR